jgi:hypothetical protein
MKFTIELMCSQSGQFDAVGNDLSAAERQLIEQWAPCFNVSLNSEPTPIPPSYLPYNAPLRCSRGLNKLIHQAERTVKADEAALWLEELNG